jgi:hypothetical protein
MISCINKHVNNMMHQTTYHIHAPCHIHACALSLFHTHLLVCTYAGYMKCNATVDTMLQALLDEGEAQQNQDSGTQQAATQDRVSLHFSLSVWVSFGRTRVCACGRWTRVCVYVVRWGDGKSTQRVSLFFVCVCGVVSVCVCVCPLSLRLRVSFLPYHVHVY